MNQIKIIISIVAFLSITELKAQTDFRPGYIIEISGDTLSGKIDYRGDLLMSSICKFKDGSNTVKEYSPNEISGFRFIDSKYFVSKKIDSTSVFLEYLLKGEVNIYYMRNRNGDHYFLEKEDIGLKEIPYDEGIKQIDDKQVYFESTQHYGVLHYYMQDAPQFQPRIMSLKKPKHRNLIKLAEDYHNTVCADEDCIIYEKKQPLLKMKIELLAGAVRLDNFENSDTEYKLKSGIITHFRLSRSNEKLYFRTGVTSSTLDSSNSNDSNKVKFKIPLHIEYIYPKGIIKPKIAVGLNIYTPFYHTVAIMGGANLKITKSIYLSLNYDLDFNTVNGFALAPQNVLSQAFTSGIIFNL